ncbi:hypothetical protein D918_05835 [Trichuris suis]|nr:hypothetical protein D918_05835 [Trichuris suis]
MISGDFRLYFNRNVQIYTDWANQYLEKNQKSRLIRDLQKDLQDSIVLIDIIECVLSSEVPNVRRKPNGRSQAIDNIASCLRYLSSIGVQLDGVTVQGIHDGQLKSILNLFYNLSWFKKEHYRMKKYQGPSKLAALNSEQKQPSRLPTSKASTGHDKLNCNTAIPSSMAGSNSGPTQMPAIPVPTEKNSSASISGTSPLLYLRIWGFSAPLMYKHKSNLSLCRLDRPFSFSRLTHIRLLELHLP